MFSRKIAVRLLIPAATLVAEKTELKCRPSELPIYTSEQPKEVVKIVREPGSLEKQIGNVRKEIMALTKHATDLQDNVEGLYREGKEQVQWLIAYLQEENNTTPKAGAIAVGGLAGFILGLRGGFFRKLIFTTAGALSMAAICYPKEAAEYSEKAGIEARRYFNIAYNFYYGVKKDDPPLELPSFPKLPTSASELWNLFGSTETNKHTVSDDHPPLEVTHNNLDETDDDSPLVGNPNAMISQAHDYASGENCHCPIGTCLNPQNEVPPTHPNQ